MVTAAVLWGAAAGACQCKPVSTSDADAGDAPADAAALSDSGDARDSGVLDAGVVRDSGENSEDAAMTPDSGGTADASVADAALPLHDAGAPPDAGWNFDAGPLHVHIYISNTCVTSIDPVEATVPPDVDGTFSFHNHSADYSADVWMGYGGGFLDLPPSQTWNDPVRHCLGPNAHDEYGDISIAGGGSASCPGVRFWIHCQ